MANRIITTNYQLEAVLAAVNDEGSSSGYISNAVLDEFIPNYSSTLRLEALRLLDLAAIELLNENTLEEAGYSPKMPSGHAENIVKGALSNGIMWLQRHHIRNAAVLNILTDYFAQVPDDGIDFNCLSESVRDDMYRIRNKIIIVDRLYAGEREGLGQLAASTLAHWACLWDNDDSYVILNDMVRFENMTSRMGAATAIRMLQAMETEYIMEKIKF